MLKRAVRRLSRLVRGTVLRGADDAPSARRRFEFAIGIYEGPSPVDLTPVGDRLNPVLTRAHVSDLEAGYVADPFMLREADRWYMFFEVWDRAARRGKIGLAVSRDDPPLHWEYQGIVLDETFHLSYPYVFEWAGGRYMTPDSKSRAVRLYKAARFPREWVFVGTLLREGRFRDPSPVYFENRWWLFTETNPRPTFDTLRLFVSDSLLGPWREHPRSPIVQGNARTARPGGRVAVADGRLFRFAQDCVPQYGTAVRAFEITRLSEADYEERELPQSPILRPARSGWNAVGMHHVDPHRVPAGRWIAAVDGWRWLA